MAWVLDRARRLAIAGAALAGLVALGGCAATGTEQGFAARYEHAAVAADHPVASEAGVEMLRQGGNAVDAAVAASFCLSVVRPYSCGIGGGGFMLIHDPGAEPVALNYRETSPAAVGPDYYERLEDDEASRFGVHAAGVPGTVAGLLLALERYGTLDRATVLAPAIRAAEDGFSADANFVKAVGAIDERLATRPHLHAHAAFLWGHLGRVGGLVVGDRITNVEQAHALRLIAEDGAAAFYTGPIADAIADLMASSGGPITRADLAGYAPVETTPLRGSYRGLEILSMPPPSSGGIAIQQIFGLLDRAGVDGGSTRLNGPDYVHLVVEAMKHAFADRASWLADDAFVDVPVNRLLDPSYLDDRAQMMRPDRTRGPYDYGSVVPAPEDGGTSHVSVVDARGMAVACTETINLRFGSLVAVPGFGFALNDEMDDFTTIPGAPNAYGLQQSDRNLPEPGKRPLSSMSPTIVLEDGRVRAVAGASGGPRIITGTLQCLLDCLLFGMTPGEAVAQPRFHHQWMPDILRFENDWSDVRTVHAMAARGHVTGRIESVGNVQIVTVDERGVHAASDPRKGGRPAGY